jgi:hypothetical protein
MMRRSFHTPLMNLLFVLYHSLMLMPAYPTLNDEYTAQNERNETMMMMAGVE